VLCNLREAPTTGGESHEIAPIGECMVELSDADAGMFLRAFGGDTLNTTLYLARLGVDTSYVAALGDKPSAVPRSQRGAQKVSMSTRSCGCRDACPAST
jgi:pfkB family carbohydrate kinase